MALDVLELGVSAHQLALVYPTQYRLNKISILDRLLVFGRPVIPAPADEPVRQARDRVLAVCIDNNIRVSRCDVEGTLACRQLCPLICLPGPLQWF